MVALTTWDCVFPWCLRAKAPSASPLEWASDLRWLGNALLTLEAILCSYEFFRRGPGKRIELSVMARKKWEDGSCGFRRQFEFDTELVGKRKARSSNTVNGGVMTN